MGPIGLREMAAALRVLAAGQLSRYHTPGASQVQQFERELAEATGVRFALAVNSGTSALICGLVGAGIGPGDEVLVPGYTWVSSAAAVLAVGAVPVLVEIDESLTIDPDDMLSKVTSRTRAVIPVHMNNLVCDMDRIMAIAREHRLFVLEDACQAVGLSYRGRKVGAIGDAGVFSFNQHKNIVSGEGGALLTNDERIYARAAMYHDVGSYIRRERFETNEPLFVGVNLRMPEISAAILRPQLRRLQKALRQKQQRRTHVVRAMTRSNWTNWQVAPHNDPANAVGLVFAFESEASAEEFGTRRGVIRLIDSGRHVHTNWESMATQRTAHARLNPYDWAEPRGPASSEALPKTIEILRRTCVITEFRELPDIAWKRVAAKMTADQSPANVVPLAN
jgi:dTDP-4-amino-4,6-dideoxygalactose transaminase